VTLHLVGKVEASQQAEAHARELALHLNTILSLQMQRVAYAFLAQHSPGNAFQDRLQRIQGEREMEAKTIDRLVAKRTNEESRWFRMRILFPEVERGLDDVVKSYKNNDRLLAAMKFAGLQKEIDEIFTLGTSLSQDESKVKEENHINLERFSRELQTALRLSLLGSAVLAFALAVYFNRGTTNRLSAIMHNTQRLAAGLSPDQIVSGNDELSLIDSTFHQLHDSLASLRKKERAILDHAADAICSLDEDFRVSDANKAAEKLWAVSSQDLLGRRVVDLINPDDQSKVYECLKECLGSGHEKSFEVRLIRVGLSEADTVWVATGSKSERSIFVVIHDVTEQKRIERLKSDFLSMVSHDLRSPLTSIQLTLSLLESQAKDSLSRQMQDNIDRAHNSANRLMALVNNLLDLDRMESGLMSILPCAESMQDIVSTAIDTLSGIATQKQLQVHNTVSEDIEVFADKDKIVQVLTNLLSNAFKFSPKGSRVTISAQTESKEVIVRVSDQGRGVPRELAATIFDRFKQVEQSDAKIGRGSGLGLAICKAIVERHGGRIGVESNPEGGSTFWFTLPVTGELPD
jgi:PAS domain S-box-containing protein